MKYGKKKKKKKARFAHLPQDGDDEADVPSQSLTSLASMASDTADTPDRPTDDSKRPMTQGQRKKYKSMRRQELIDLHLTLSRHRDQLIVQMTNVSNVILELAEAYHDLKSSTCVPCYLCELDLLIQESLAAYDRRQKDANHPIKAWSELISKEAWEKKRKRRTIIAEQPKRRFTDLYAIPITKLQHEVRDLESDIEVYRRRIAIDDKKMSQMGEQWATDKKRLCCFRYFYLKEIIENAITDYKVDRRLAIESVDIT